MPIVTLTKTPPGHRRVNGGGVSLFKGRPLEVPQKALDALKQTVEDLGDGYEIETGEKAAKDAGAPVQKAPNSGAEGGE